MSTHRKWLSVPAACLLFLFASAAVPAADPSIPDPDSPKEETGTLGKAPYRVDFPGRWNGELVMLAHGFEPAGVPRTEPWPQNEATGVFLSAGYAVAQSGYSSQGWAIREAVEDTEQLRRHFIGKYGATRSYLVGFSMGGGVAIASLEQHSAHYDGALSLCGVNVPGRWLIEELFTTLVAFDHFFPDAKGLAGGLSDPASAASDQMSVMQAVASALALEPDAAALLAAHLQVPGEALPGVISLHHMVFRDVAQRAAGMPVDNRTTRYRGFGDDEAFNASVRRYAGDAAAMRHVAAAPALTGDPRKPLVIQYNRDDPTVAPRFQSVYADLAKKAAPAPVTPPLVGEGHCGFSGEQIAAAFRVLTDWVESGERPALE